MEDRDYIGKVVKYEKEILGGFSMPMWKSTSGGQVGEVRIGESFKILELVPVSKNTSAYFICEKDNIKFVIASWYVMNKINEKIFCIVEEQSKDLEDHTGMIQGFNGEWRWF